MNNILNMKDLLRNKKEEVKKAVALLFVLGVSIMIIGSSEIFRQEKETENVPVIQTENYYNETEKKLEEILGSVSGAGKVKVMITYSQSSEKVAAQQVRREEQGGGESSSFYENTYVLKDTTDGGTDAVVLTEYMPLPLGVLIVAQGGDNIYVKQSLSSAAQALLGVPAHKIEVLKMEG